MFLLIGAAFGVALAATILIGQNIGANNLDETKRVVGTQRHLLRRHLGGDGDHRAGVLSSALARDAHPARLGGAGGGLHAGDFPGAAVPLHLCLRHGGAARRRGLQDALLLHAAVGRHRHRPESGAHLRLRSHPAPGDRRLRARHFRGAGGEPHGPDQPPLPAPPCAGAAPGRARLPAPRLDHHRRAHQEGHSDERPDAGGFLERGAHDHARQPLRRRYHGGFRCGAADLELHPDAGIRSRRWASRR